MNTKNIIQHVKENGGISLDKNLDIPDLSDGYMVSIKRYEYITNIYTITSIRNRIRYVKGILKKGEYIGLWYDDKKLYIDISKNIKEIDKAKKYATINEQIAIYDIANNDSVYM